MGATLPVNIFVLHITTLKKSIMTFDKTSYFRLPQRVYGHFIVIYWLDWLTMLLCTLLTTIHRAEWI